MNCVNPHFGSAAFRWTGVGLVFLCLLGSPVLPGALTLPGIFSDHMMLQRDRPLRFWGTGDENTTITVALNRQQGTTNVKEGRWELELPPESAGGPYEVTVSDGRDTRVIRNVLIGDVWLCGGQSNMQFPVFKSLQGKQALQEPAHPGLRYFKQSFDGTPEPRDDVVRGHWNVDSPESRKWIYAVGYYFAREIQAAEAVPVGLLLAAHGGTSVQMWTPLQDLEASEAYRYYLNAYREYASSYAERKTDYLTRKAEAEKTGEKIPVTEHYGWFPAAAYNAMIHPLRRFPIKGVIWYQGESNADPFQAELYHQLFPDLIRAWRREFREDDLPFLFVQLPGFDAPENRDWPLLREAQSHTHRTLPHTGMAVTLDLGDDQDIHPANKQPVGERLARIALHQVYHRDVSHEAPSVVEARVSDGRVQLTFGPDEIGLTTTEGVAPTEFELLGPAGEPTSAAAELAGSTVTLWSPDVPHPVSVRYAWRNAPAVTLFGTNGLPVAPFQLTLPLPPSLPDTP